MVQPQNSPQLLYTVPEAATALRISRSRLYELIRSGQISTIKIGASRRITTTALVTYIHNLEQDAA